MATIEEEFELLKKNYGVLSDENSKRGDKILELEADRDRHVREYNLKSNIIVDHRRMVDELREELRTANKKLQAKNESSLGVDN